MNWRVWVVIGFILAMGAVSLYSSCTNGAQW